MAPPIRSAYTYVYDNYYVYGEKHTGFNSFELTIEEHSQNKYTVHAWMDNKDKRWLSISRINGSGSYREEDRAREIKHEIENEIEQERELV